jgi:hypothetical protein
LHGVSSSSPSYLLLSLSLSLPRWECVEELVTFRIISEAKEIRI